MADGNNKNGCLTIFLIGVIAAIIVPSINGYNKKKNEAEDPSVTPQVQVNDADSSQNQGAVNVNSNGEAEQAAVEQDNELAEGVTSDEVTEEANQIIYDDGEIKITYTGYTAEKAFSSAKINFLIENNSSRNISVRNFNLNVNGYTFSTWFYEDVPAGKKSNAEMSISRTQLADNSIDTLGVVDMDFKCTDSDTYDELFTTDNVQIIFDDTVSNEENLDDYQLVADNAGVQVYFKGENDGNWLSTASYTFLVVNNSDQNVTVRTDNLSVNDFAVSSSFHTDCMAGKMSNDTLTFYPSDLEKNGIENIEKIEFTLKCYNSDTWHDIWQMDNVVITVS